MRPVPVGVSGELFIGGAGVARGYLDRPELTAERFVADPFGDCPGSRLYRTGDLARYRDDGIVDYVGRIDNQVKLRGYRIELGEIESVLSTHPEVRENAVVVRGEAEGQQQLVAYVVGREGRPAADELRRYLADRLPEFMVPAAFAFLDTLPRTPNQKVDRLALPAPTPSDGAGCHVAPRDELERQLATIWERELNIAPIGITDNFFHLGGDSLLAVRLFSQIEKALGTSLPVATLFTAQTIEQLAAILRREGWLPAEGKAALSSSRPTSLVAVRRAARGAASRIVLHALLKRKLLRLRRDTR
jgi:acyl carrier protein